MRSALPCLVGQTAHPFTVFLIVSLLVAILSGRAPADVLPDAAVVAQTGSDGLVEIAPYPSINQNGLVAFVGRTQADDGRLMENLYAWEPGSGNGMLRRLFNDDFMLPRDGDDPTQTFGPQVRINDADQVLARRYLRASILFYGTWQTIPLTYLETWDARTAQASYCNQITMAMPELPGAFSSSIRRGPDRRSMCLQH